MGGKPPKQIDTALEKAAKRAGVRCTAHILKHSAISYMAEQSFNCTQLTAHLTIVTSDVYKVSAVADTFLLKLSIISLDLASS